MVRIPTFLTVLAALALSTPVAAQDTQSEATDVPTESEATAPETTEAPTEPDAQAPETGGAQLDLGEPVDQTPQVGERYSKQKFGDWDLACIRTEAETDPCSLLQILSDTTGNPVAEVSLFRIEGNGQAIAGGTIIVPLETLLPARLTISVDGGAGRRYDYSFCNPIGCVAQVGFTQADIDAFKRGREAVLSLVPAQAPDQTVRVTMSLTGFTAGFDVVDVVPN